MDNNQEPHDQSSCSKPNQTPNRETVTPGNNSSLLPENYSENGFLNENNHQSYPVFDPSRLNPNRPMPGNNNSGTLFPENYSGLGSFQENNHPGFDPSRLNPSYDLDSVLLGERIESLHLSTPRNQYVSPPTPADFVLRSREQSLVRGQNGSLYGGLYPQELGSTYQGDHLDYLHGGLYPQELGTNYNDESLVYPNLMGSQNRFTGHPGQVYNRYNNLVNGPLFEPGSSSNPNSNMMGSSYEFAVQPGSVYDHNSWVNGSSFEPGNLNRLYQPSLNQNGLHRSSFNENGYYGPSSNQSRLFREQAYAYTGLKDHTGNNRINGSRLDPVRSSWPRENRNGVFLDPYAPNGLSSPFSSRPSSPFSSRPSSSFSSRLNQGRSRPINNDMGWRSSPNSNGLSRDSLLTSNRLSRSQNGLFSKSMHTSNGSGSSLLSPRAGHDRRTVHSESGRVGDTYTGKLNLTNGRPNAEYANRNLKDFRGKLVEMAKNRDGSAFMKKKLDDGTLEDFELIFEEVKNDVVGLMVNYFGNSVVQKVIMGCVPDQISYILNLLVRGNKKQFAEICCDNHGSLAMEKLLQNLRTHEQRSLIISALRGIVVNLSKDANGLKVVQYCIVHFPENVDMLINEIANRCFEIATHKSGCVILQDCLGKAGQETMERFIDELGPNILFLSEHPYGNYVVQYLLDKKNPSITEIILSWLAGNYATLSMHKCSSNVVEKCLVVATEEEAAEIIVEIMNSDNFKMVIQNPYGNYVVQKALDVCQNMRHGDLHVRLSNRIMSLHGSLNTHPFGNRVISKLNHRSKPF